MNKLEQIGQQGREWREKIMGDKFKESTEKLGLAQTAKNFLESLNVRPAFKKDGEPVFSEMRKRLNQEAGVVIANHPGDFDLLCVLSSVDRRDIKFMVGECVYDMWSNIFGKDLVVPALRMHGSEEDARRYEERKKQKERLSNEEIENRQKVAVNKVAIIRSILDHINRGGLFVYFPTGGDDSRNMQRFEFKNLFRLLVNKMKPTDMVYAFNIQSNEKKRSKPERGLRIAGSFSDALTGGKININRFAEPLEIEVDEQYSQVAEWKNLLSNDKSRDRQKMTENYLAKFPEFRRIVDHAKEKTREGVKSSVNI